MAEWEQERPLAGASVKPTSDEEEAVTAVNHKKSIRHQRCIIYSGCCAAFTVILAVVIIILFCTIFKVKQSKITLLNIKINGLNDVVKVSSSSTNFTFSSDFSIKNPNYASFKYNNFTTSLIYYGTNIGEAQVPHGNAKARKTTLVNVTIDVVLNDAIKKSSYLVADGLSGLFNISTYADITGKVIVLGIYKKQVEIKSNCSFSYDILTQETVEKHCKSQVSY
jgi:hypothetical protein